MNRPRRATPSSSMRTPYERVTLSEASAASAEGQRPEDELLPGLVATDAVGTHGDDVPRLLGIEVRHCSAEGEHLGRAYEGEEVVEVLRARQCE